MKIEFYKVFNIKKAFLLKHHKKYLHYQRVLGFMVFFNFHIEIIHQNYMVWHLNNMQLANHGVLELFCRILKIFGVGVWWHENCFMKIQYI